MRRNYRIHLIGTQNVLEATGPANVYEGVLTIGSYRIPLTSILYWEEI